MATTLSSSSSSAASASAADDGAAQLDAVSAALDSIKIDASVRTVSDCERDERLRRAAPTTPVPVTADNTSKPRPARERIPHGPRFVTPRLDESKLRIFSREQLTRLDSDGFFTVDNFLGPQAAESVRQEVLGLWDKGALKPAGMISGGQVWHDKNIRGDSTLWLTDRSVYAASCPVLVGTLLGKLDAIRAELNAATRLCSQSQQTMVALYPGGSARYVRHLDATRTGTKRRLTLIFYLKKDWEPSDGGCLRIYLPPKRAGETERQVDVPPLLGRLLVFQSRRLEHEVLPAFSTRSAVTTWFY